MYAKSIENQSIKIVRLRDVIAKTGLARSTIYAKTSPKSASHDPCFPKPIRLGLRTVGWLEEELQSWILSCPRARAKMEEKQ